MNIFGKDQDQTVILVYVTGLQLFSFKSYRIFQNNFILGYEIQKDRYYRNKRLLATTRFLLLFMFEKFEK